MATKQTKAQKDNEGESLLRLKNELLNKLTGAVKPPQGQTYPSWDSAIEQISKAHSLYRLNIGIHEIISLTKPGEGIPSRDFANGGKEGLHQFTKGALKQCQDLSLEDINPGFNQKNENPFLTAFKFLSKSFQRIGQFLNNRLPKNQTPSNVPTSSQAKQPLNQDPPDTDRNPLVTQNSGADHPVIDSTPWYPADIMEQHASGASQQGGAPYATTLIQPTDNQSRPAGPDSAYAALDFGQTDPNEELGERDPNDKNPKNNIRGTQQGKTNYADISQEGTLAMKTWREDDNETTDLSNGPR